MSRPMRRSLALALAGLAAGLGLVVALSGGWDALRRGVVPAAGPAGEAAKPLADLGTPRPGATPAEPDRTPGTAGGAPGPATAARPDPGAAGGPEAPSFDIVRVEPNGDAVVAGRGAPNTVVEMLVDGKPVAKALADPNGQFAIVPPALPAGASEIQLRTRDAKGGEARSQQSVAVDVAPGRDRRPLVALTAPDRPTVVLSQPGAPERDARAEAGPGAAKPGEVKPGDVRSAQAKPEAAQPARIVSVDAQANGRLYVTAAGTPGASLRLYLNDTLIAPGRVGPDGRVTFTIGRGVEPGQYQVRIDEIDPGTTRVRSRAEVPFAAPEPARMAARAAPPPAGEGNEGRGDGGRAPAGGAAQAPPAPEPRIAARPARPEAPGPDAAGPNAAAAARPGTAGPTARPAEGGPAAVGTVFVPEISTARISRGDNLWRISQRTYGRGERYTVIYDANQHQIRNPDLIYPGQIFVLPGDKRG